MSNLVTNGIDFMTDYWSDNLVGSDNSLSDLMIQHLVLSAKAIGISIAIGLPVGAILGHLHRFSFIAINTSNVARALPTVAVLALLLPLTQLEDRTAIIALVILGAPPILTNTYVAVDGVDDDTVDAARGIGLKPWQVLARVELPLALPLIFAGVRTAAVFVVATATLKGFFGGGGLGDVIANASSFGLAGVVGATIVLIGLAIASQIFFLVLEAVISPRGLRVARPSRFRRWRNSRRSGPHGGAEAANDRGDDYVDTVALTTSGQR